MMIADAMASHPLKTAATETSDTESKNNAFVHI